MKNRAVLISGAGVAGPTLAYWLARHGFAPTIVERATEIRPGGQAVDLRGASRYVAERMGILDEVRSLAVHERGMAYVDAQGRRRFQMPVEMFDGAGAVSDIEILRGDLARVLHEAAATDTEYLFDDTITEIRQHTAGVDVSFERAPARTFDLVVGADGLHSRVRSLAFGEEREFVRPLGGYASFLTIPKPEYLEDWAVVHSMGQGRVAMIRPDRAPGQAKATLMFTAGALEYDRADTEQQKQIVADRFAGVTWEMPRILDALATAGDFYLDELARVQVDHWSRGRVSLVGDAVHCGSPLAGHGTALAMVGAYVLAGELAAADGDHVRAFTAYQGELSEYVTRCQQLPPGGLRAMAPRTLRGIRLRDAYGRLMTTGPMTRLIARVMTSADDIMLKEYAERSVATSAGSEA